MHTLRGMELEVDVVKVTWCACERCAALGPRLITLIRNNREYTSSLRADCCRVRPPPYAATKPRC